MQLVENQLARIADNLIKMHRIVDGASPPTSTNASSSTSTESKALNTGNPSGTGLGLYISRQPAVRHGRTLAIVESSPGTGSVFELRLPRAR